MIAPINQFIEFTQEGGARKKSRGRSRAQQGGKRRKTKTRKGKKGKKSRKSRKTRGRK